MEKIQLICACSLLLAAISCDILYTEGRPLKSLKEREFSSIDFEPGSDKGSQGASFQEHNPSVKDTVAGKNELLSPMIPKHSNGVGVSKALIEIEAQPTPPGPSPGVGHHHLFPLQEDIQPKAPRSPIGSHAVAAYQDDYRPTKPGHSPGIGHSLQITNAKPNV